MIQYWLGKIGKGNRPILEDGPHDEKKGADEAAYIYKRLGLKTKDNLVVFKIEILPVTTNKVKVNEEAINIINKMCFKR